MFSRRLPDSLEATPFSLAVKTRRQKGAPWIDLTGSNPTHVGLGPSEPALQSVWSQVRWSAYTPEPLGTYAARAAVSSALREDHGVEIDPSRLVLTASSSESYAWLFKLLCDPGDAVLVPMPSYPLFDLLAGLEKVHATPYALAYDGSWHVDFDALARAVTAGSRAVVAVHPNNPTGSFLSPPERVQLASFCADRSLALIVDEVFVDHAWDPAPARRSMAGTETCLTFALGGLSKRVAVPQAKLGWMAASGPGDLVSAALERLEIVADTYLSVGTAVQQAAPGLLSLRHAVTGSLMARVRENLARLDAALRDAPISRLHAEAGWVATLRLPATRTEYEWASALLEAGVLVQPGWFYDHTLDPCIVLSLITPPRDFEAGLETITARVNALA